MKQLVDTNVWVRYFVRDNEKQYLQVCEWFEEASKGKRELVVTPVIVAEVCYVLESFYKNKREDISQTFKLVLAQSWLKIENREVLSGVWFWYEKGVHFVDSYALAWKYNNDSQILTFDIKLKKLAEGN
jgi:predicted nucleic-acid-binding protein